MQKMEPFLRWHKAKYYPLKSTILFLLIRRVEGDTQPVERGFYLRTELH